MGHWARPAQRIGAVASAVALAGCALISGAGDLTVGAVDAVPDTNAGGTDGAASPDGLVMPGNDGGSQRLDAASGDAIVPSEGGDAGSRLRNVTFEDGSLLGVHGGDSLAGLPSIVTTGALAGADSMDVDTSPAGIQVDVPMLSEVYVTALVRADTVTLSDDITLIAFVPEFGGTSAELHLQAGFAGLQAALVVGGSVVGASTPIAAKTAYRVGFHLRQDSTTHLLEIFSASPGQPFGPAILTSPSVLGRTIGVRMGSLGATKVTAKLTFDDLFIDTLAMPAP